MKIEDLISLLINLVHTIIIITINNNQDNFLQIFSLILMLIPSLEEIKGLSNKISQDSTSTTYLEIFPRWSIKFQELTWEIQIYKWTLMGILSIPICQTVELSSIHLMEGIFNQDINSIMPNNNNSTLMKRRKMKKN